MNCQERVSSCVDWYNPSELWIQAKYYKCVKLLFFRYGRSKTTFTFEAGRKCTSGEGYFTFKVESGDVIFTSVQKRTQEMKKKVSTTKPPAVNKAAVSRSSAETSSSDDISPALPARKYIPECETSEDSVTNKVKMFEQGPVKPSSPDVKKPPVLKKLNKPPVPANKPSLDRLDGVDGNRMTQGYELAKTVFPISPKDAKSPPPRYEDGDRIKTLDVTYKEATNANGTDKGPGSPVYAVYDIAGSSRVTGPVYDDPAEPYYDYAAPVKSFGTTASFEYAEPYISTTGDAWRKQGHKTDNIHIERYEQTNPGGDIEADCAIYEDPDENLKQGPSKISEISNRLKNQRIDSNEYDRIDVHKTLPNRQRAPLPAIPGQDNSSEYGQLSPPQKDQGRKLFKKK